MSTDQQNLYEVLGLQQNASRDLIEEQCILLGERYRPDKNSGNLLRARAFEQIEKAYETLGNPVKRAAYDSELLLQRAKSTERKSAGGSVAVVVSVLAIISILGYALVYRPYITQREEAARIAAEETRRIAAETAKKAAEQARLFAMQVRAAEEQARQAETRMRSDQIEAQRQSALARLADTEDFARVESLRAQCDAAPRGNDLTGIGALLNIRICAQAEQAVKNRQRYEAMRSVDPVAAAKELQAQRDRRLSNRPVVTNCTAGAPGYATCISR